MKECIICKVNKELVNFYKDKTREDGLVNKCILCYKEKKKIWYNENIIDRRKAAKVYREKNPEKTKQYNDKNIEYIKKFRSKPEEREKDKIYYQNNKEELSKKGLEYYYNNKEERVKYSMNYNKERRKVDPEFKISCYIRNRIWYALKSQNIRKNNSTIDLLNCTFIEYKQYLESKFLPEMNWENYGEIWEIDHIIPCASFDFTKLEEQMKCFHFNNLQPLFKTTKIAKSLGYENYIGNRDKGDRIL